MFKPKPGPDFVHSAFNNKHPQKWCNKLLRFCRVGVGIAKRFPDLLNANEIQQHKPGPDAAGHVGTGPSPGPAGRCPLLSGPQLQADGAVPCHALLLLPAGLLPQAGHPQGVGVFFFFFFFFSTVGDTVGSLFANYHEN